MNTKFGTKLGYTFLYYVGSKNTVFWDVFTVVSMIDVSWESDTWYNVPKHICHYSVLVYYNIPIFLNYVTAISLLVSIITVCNQ
jgi:hypothetical protein